MRPYSYALLIVNSFTKSINENALFDVPLSSWYTMTLYASPYHVSTDSGQAILFYWCVLFISMVPRHWCDGAFSVVTAAFKVKLKTGNITLLHCYSLIVRFTLLCVVSLDFMCMYCK